MTFSIFTFVTYSSGAFFSASVFSSFFSGTGAFLIGSGSFFSGSTYSSGAFFAGNPYFSGGDTFTVFLVVAITYSGRIYSTGSGLFQRTPMAPQ